MTILSLSGLSPVTEKYVGKNHREFKVIEAELEKIIKQMKRDFKPIFDRVRDGSVLDFSKKVTPYNISDSNKIIERMFTKFFDLKGFNLVWIASGQPNAITPCRTFTFLDKGADKTGRYSNKNLTINTVFDINLVIYYDLTAEEVMAIILHEIGHNFYNSIFQLVARLPINFLTLDKLSSGGMQAVYSTLLVLGVFDAVNFHSAFAKGIMEINRVLEKYVPWLYNAFRLFEEMKFNILGFKRGLKVLDLVGIFRKQYLGMLATDHIFKYHAERFADNFAADHGYGPQMASAAEKFELKKNTLFVRATRDVPVLNVFTDFIDLQMEFMYMMLDEHPKDSIRIRAGLDRLRNNAKDPNLPPNLRKELEGQIADYEDFYYKHYLPIEGSENKKRIFSWMYKVSVEKLFAGKLDFRELSWMMDPKSKAF